MDQPVSYQHYLWTVAARVPRDIDRIEQAARLAGFKTAHTYKEEGHDFRSFQYGILAAKTEAAALWLQMNTPQS